MARAALVLATLILAACAHVREPDSGRAGPCRTGAIRYDTIHVASDPIYVEPQTLSVNRDRLLVAGRFAYRFTNVGGHYRHAEAPFGLVLGPGASVAALSSPLPRKTFESSRAVPIPGGWAVVFAEILAREGRPDSVTGLWYGEVRGLQWNHLERIPAQALDFGLRGASALLSTPRGPIWMLPVSVPNHALLVLRRRNGRWESELIRTSTPRAEAVLMPNGSLAIIAIQADSTLWSDDSSILLRREDAGWGVTQVLSSGQTEPAGNIDYHPRERGGVLTWTGQAAPGQHRLRARITDDLGIGRVVTVDSGISLRQPLGPAALPDDALVWGTTRGDSAATVRLHAMARDSIHLLDEFADPFLGGFAMEAIADTLVLVGAVANGRRYFASLVVRIPVRCGPART